MKNRRILLLILVCLAWGMFNLNALADRENPGSVLLFPYLNTTQNHLGVFSITNTSKEDIWVRFVWIDKEDCFPNDLWLKLTGQDTFTFMPDELLFAPDLIGFLYVYVVEDNHSTAEVNRNVLIGQEFYYEQWLGSGYPTLVSYSFNAIPFQADTVNGDGMLQLDGVEFNLAPKTIYFPRFFGQDGRNFISKVIFINLTGGAFFRAEVNLYVFNDNEVAFSSTENFPCYDFIYLEDMSKATTKAWLLGTAHDPIEPYGLINGIAETGWMSLTAQYAWNPDIGHTINNASIYAVLVENLFGSGHISDLPMQVEDEQYNNASLWSVHPFGQ